MKKLQIIISGILILIAIVIALILYEGLTKSDVPTILHTREPSELCAVFDRTWNSNTNTCDYMSQVECGFSLGEWNECVLFENYCHPADTLCEAPPSCISTCIFGQSTTKIIIPEP